ncbi:cytochrome b [Thiospirillum jenense]|uniref:Cytochrome b/b6 domain-containing protein n=1 Tax=Thiospirillum jenense TaxID=1653858 RepID=A0A839HER6_9GAMM|nr:cytochrome b/b6 domain-containing protein [Thiospirillum jenense]MBB1125677.1 cytochrome b/b6 domain-containing protein [Thiospirillum jenense]
MSTDDTQLSTRYGIVAQSFHWLVVVLIVGLLVTNALRESAPKGEEAYMMYLGLHMSVGILLFFITIARIAWARVTPPPAPISSAPQWSLAAARIAHVLLNLATLFIPIFGYLRIATKGFDAQFFGVSIPSITGDIRWLHEVMEVLHGDVMVIGLMTLLILHVAAAIWHQYILRDGALERMLPWGR